MPHVSIKHWPRDFTETERTEVVEGVVSLITQKFDVPEGAVSLAVESVPPDRWRGEVHMPEIEERSHLLWKRPEYGDPIPGEERAI